MRSSTARDVLESLWDVVDTISSSSPEALADGFIPRASGCARGDREWGVVKPGLANQAFENGDDPKAFDRPLEGRVSDPERRRFAAAVDVAREEVEDEAAWRRTGRGGASDEAGLGAT